MRDRDIVFPSSRDDERGGTWARVWCWLTFRHGGRIDHDNEGVHWTCVNCHHRITIRWEDVELGGES